MLKKSNPKHKLFCYASCVIGILSILAFPTGVAFLDGMNPIIFLVLAGALTPMPRLLD